MTTSETLIATSRSYKPEAVKSGLLTEHAEKLQERLPAGVDLPKWTAAVVELLEANPKCLGCTKESIVKAVYEAATAGLPAGNDLFYFVPRSIKGANSLTFQIGYKGQIQLAKQSGQVKDIYSRLVFDGDEFNWIQGGDEKIEHTPALDAEREQRPISHVYAVAVLPCGRCLFECWSRDRLEQHVKNHVKGGWDPKDWQAMAKKTLVRVFFNTGRLQQTTDQRG